VFVIGGKRYVEPDLEVVLREVERSGEARGHGTARRCKSRSGINRYHCKAARYRISFLPKNLLTALRPGTAVSVGILPVEKARPTDRQSVGNHFSTFTL
jgi:hypothetical protein